MNPALTHLLGVALLAAPCYAQAGPVATVPTTRPDTARHAAPDAIRPFKVHIPEKALIDLRRRIAATQWPERETVADQSQGVPLATMRELSRYWETEYDWRKVEAQLNALPQFTTTIDGLDIHFIHVRSREKNALPLIINHGWPGSVLDWGSLGSPENYVGYGRTENFASPGGAAFDKPHVYAPPRRLGLNQWALSGDWTVGRQATVSNQARGRVVYRFHARDLHLVMGPSKPGTSVRFRVLIDGQPPGAGHGLDVDAQGYGTITEQRLYQLIRQPKPIADREFAIEFLWTPASRCSRSRSDERRIHGNGKGRISAKDEQQSGNDEGGAGSEARGGVPDRRARDSEAGRGTGADQGAGLWCVPQRPVHQGRRLAWHSVSPRSWT